MNETIIKDVCNSIIKKADKELYSKTKKELEEYFYFDFNKAQDNVYSYYKFFQALEIYRNFCEQWEEYHNGSIMVVERVRNNYLIPKIWRFRKYINQKDQKVE